MGATTFYFAHQRDAPDIEMPADLSFGFSSAYFCHFGSIAFGSFIIIFVKIIRFVFYHISKKMKGVTGDNAITKCVMCCGTCILHYIEKICEYLNNAAFCYMAVTGEPFLASAWNGFLLNLKHGIKFGFAKFIATIFIFNGKISIVVVNCYNLYLLMMARKDMEDVNSIQGPMIVVAIVTYMIASLFLSLFDETV